MPRIKRVHAEGAHRRNLKYRWDQMEIGETRSFENLSFQKRHSVKQSALQHARIFKKKMTTRTQGTTVFVTRVL